MKKTLSSVEEIKNFFDSISDKEIIGLKSNYFHSEDLLMLKEIIPESSNVLEIGCGNGQLIGRLNVKGVGIDLSEKLINKAKKSYPHLKFYVGDINNSSKLLKNEKKFDYIIITDTVGYFQDVQKRLSYSIFIVTKKLELLFLIFHLFGNQFFH